MPTPTNRTPVRVARGTYSNLNSSVSDIQEGEICYATDQDILYVKEGSSLVNASHNLASPTFTGTPAAPTANPGTNTTQIATTAYVDSATANLVNSAPATLDTLNELAAALNDDANFSTTVTDSIALKASLNGASFTGNVIMGEALEIERVREKVTINTGTSLTGAIDFEVKTNGSVLYYTPDATGNYSVNVKGDNSGLITIDNLMGQGEVLTVVLLATYGSTPYYMTGVTVDGAAATVRWIGGAPSSAGTANSICANHISIIKTGSATFTVLVSKSEYEA
tara:strand:- start:407 stop:1249 length:843 start_codon:yes stop_codon:yes gene_type:complete